MTGTRTRGLTPLLIGATCVLALLAAYTITGLLSQDAVIDRWAGTVTIAGPEQVDAGTDVTVVIAADVADGTPVQLGVFAPLDSAMLTTPIEQGSARFTIEAQTVRHAGLYRLVAQIDSGVSETHELRVTALGAVNPVVPFVGPRTIIADGSDITMTVVTPMDQFGNPVADDTAVDIAVGRPGGESSVITQRIDRALAAIIIEATTEAGRVTVSASTGSTDGPSTVVDQVAGSPAPFTVTVDTRDTLADGFALHQIQTSELTDRFGNVLPDGVSAVFVIEDDSGTSFLQAVVQGGVARTMLEAPNAPGTTVVLARVSGIESPPVSVDFAPAIASLAASRSTNGGRVVLSVGPVVSERGGYVADGTMVTIVDRTSGEQIAQAALRGGVAEIVVDAVDAESVDVVVLGTRIPIEEP